MRLTATGRRTGRRRGVIVGYFENGLDLVTMAMNGWGGRRACLVAQPASATRAPEFSCPTGPAR
jgi:hypothetical protein